MTRSSGRPSANYPPQESGWQEAGCQEPWWLAPARLFDGFRFHDDTALRIEAGRITAIAPTATIDDGAWVIRSGRLACPGYVDLQVNGGGGVLFNNDPTPEGLRAIGAAHRGRGTTSWLPTLITDTPDTLDRAIDAVLACLGEHGVAGLHIEGPHINPTRKGTHDATLIRPFDARTLAGLERLRRAGVPTMLTLAPECLPPRMIEALVEMGVVVSAGHSAASAAQIDAALDSGLRCFTHLHNAMTPMLGREPGVVGAALNSEAWIGMIVDGHHVSDAMCAVSLRAALRPDRMFLVSDAMATVNGPDRFVLYGEEIRVDGGRLVNSQGALAGAHIDMATSVRRLIDAVGLTPERALMMATSTPASAMGLAQMGGLRPGCEANILLLNADFQLDTPIIGGARR